MFPVFRWIIIEGQQRIPVLDQLGHRFVPFHAIGFDKDVEGDVGFSFGFSLLDVVEVAFGFRLHGLRHRPLVARTSGATGTTVQHVHGLVIRGSARSRLN